MPRRDHPGLARTTTSGPSASRPSGMGCSASTPPGGRSRPIFTWADSRSAPDAALLRGALDDATLHDRTGCHLHSSYWPAKLRWLARERPADVAPRRLLGIDRRAPGARALRRDGDERVDGLGHRPARPGHAALGRRGAGGGRRRVRAALPARRLRGGRRGLRAPWSGRWPSLRSVPWFPAVGDGAASNVGSDCIDPSRIALNVGTSAAMRLVTADHGGGARAGSGATGSTGAARWSAARPPRAATCTRGAATS